jgi:hypothetical protein
MKPVTWRNGLGSCVRTVLKEILGLIFFFDYKCQIKNRRTFSNHSFILIHNLYYNLMLIVKYFKFNVYQYNILIGIKSYDSFAKINYKI